MAIKKFSITVESVGRGLLMHKFSAEASADIEKEVQKNNKVRASAKDQAEQVSYRLSPENGETIGQLYLPSEHFLGALTKASAGLKLAGKKTYKDRFRGSLDISPDCIPLLDADGKKLIDYAIDSRAVVIRATKGRIIRHRPHLKYWRAEFEIIAEEIPLEVVQSALEEAGKSIGVADYRPRYGQFRIVKFEEVK